MKKILQIAFKDLLITFRDPASLLLMLLAPYLLTLGLGAVTGSFSDERGTVEPIPVAVVNEDPGDFGAALVEVLRSEEMAEFLVVTVLEDEATARAQVEEDEVAAAILIPADFSTHLLPSSGGGTPSEEPLLELYANPTRPISVGIVETIVGGFVERVQETVGSVEVIVGQLVSSGRVSPAEIPALAEALGRELVETEESAPAITLDTVGTADSEAPFNPLTLLAPAMAVFFLMYTVGAGARGILTEWEEGTLPRLLTTPTRISQILAGKMLGIFMMGVLQLSILILATGLMFGLEWGSPLPVALLILALAAAATGWGLLLAAFSRSAAQVSGLGSAMMLLFGILGGSFVTFSFTGILNVISHLTPNAWAAEGFLLLASGGTLSDLLPILSALLGMAALLFAISNLSLLRRWA